jgi:hypothetical protein
MDLFTRYLAILMIFIFANNEVRIAQPIELQPDSIDRFVMDPATFREDDNSNSIWRLAPFGRKKPTIYRSGKKDNGEPIIKASSN